MEDWSKLAEYEVVSHAAGRVRFFVPPEKAPMRFERCVELRAGIYDVESFGAYSYMGGGTNTQIRHVSSIGRFCAIAGNVVIGQVEHPTNFLSVSPVLHGKWDGSWPSMTPFYSENSVQIDGSIRAYQAWAREKKGKIVIGNDVWIGEGAFVSRGVRIGDGAIIAARSVVTKDVPPYAIVAGVPAKVIRYRFSEEVIARLLRLQWWAFGLNALKGVNFTRIEEALDKIEENILAGADVYARNRVQYAGANGIQQVPPDISLITGSRTLETVRVIGGRPLILDFNDAHERAYYYSERPHHETVDTRIARRLLHKGDVVLDAGANIGHTALHFLEAGAREVHAFEPVDSIFRRLERLRSDRLLPYKIALGNEDAEREIVLSSMHRQGSTLSPRMIEKFPRVFGNEAHTETISVRRLDDLLPEVKFDFMKVDIEGLEGEFILGAGKHFSSRCPRVLQIEIYPEFFEKTHAALAPHFPFAYRVFINQASRDLIFVPVGAPASADCIGDPPIYVYTHEELSA